MAFRAKCPVCRTGVMVRPDVRTCSPICAQEWRQWTPQQRASAVESANEPLNVVKVIESLNRERLISKTSEASDELPKPTFLDELLKR